MVHNPLPSDKFQIKQRPDLQTPAICASCGNGTCREGYLDPSVFYEWEGNVYFCMKCAREAAKAIGCLTPEESKYLEEQNLEIAKELKELKEAHERAVSRLAVYDSVVIAASSSDPNCVSEQVEQVEQGHSADTVSTSDTGESEPKEPVKVARRSNVKRPTVRNQSVTL